MHRTLSSTSALAVGAMIDLALQSRAGPIASKLIGQRQAISESYLDQLLSKLRRHGLVQSTRGPRGGYSLARDAELISVADIVVAVDKAWTATLRGRDAQGSQAGAGLGLTNELWHALNATLFEWLAGISLKALVDERLARDGALVETASIRRAISPRSPVQPLKVTAPNSVFALACAPSTRAQWAR